MASRREYITRGELLGGILATGALAACGGGATPTPTPTTPDLCGSAAQTLPDISKILSDPAFNSIDKALLEKIFAPSPNLAGVDAGYFTQTGQQRQTSTVISSIPPAGIVIQSPGTYTFAGNITWTPTATAPSSAITIACSGVTLNLAGWTLRAVADVSVQTTGILVAASASAALDNVMITGGNIANFTEYGIFAKSVCGLDILRITVSGLCLQNLNVRNLTPAGIYAVECLNVTIGYCSVTQSKVKTDSSAGIFVDQTIGAAVRNCQTTYLQNLDGAVIGFSCIRSTNVATTSCTAKYLQSFFGTNTLTTGHTVLGFCPIACLSMSYIDCAASNLTGSCDDVHGISVFIDGLVLVERFTADTIVDGPPPYNTGAKATGIEVYGVGVTVKDSTASNITANNPQDLQATGFSAWGISIGFDTCTATNVVVNGPGNGTGFGWAPDPRTVFKYPAKGVAYTNCTAVNCAVGFDTFYHQNSVWTNLTTTNCPTPVLINPTEQRRLTCDAGSECTPTSQFLPPDFAPGPPPYYYETLTNDASGNIFL